MHDFTRKFLTEWRKLNLPFEGETFIAAVSGGADSVALLLVLADLRERKKLKNRVVIAHFDHKLRGAESAKDAELVKSLCVKYDYELALGSSGSDISKRGNTEQNARVARYDFLRETAENLRARAVLTAHTVNDQAETFLINLIRGSGLAGLSGMPAVRILEEEKRRGGEENPESGIRNPESEFGQSEIRNPKSEILLLRPFLSWARREDTENFCRLNEIEYAHDAMNEDLAFRRVRVRKVLLPLLADFNPKIIETLANTANLLRETANETSETKDQKPKTKNQKPEIKDRFLVLRELKTLPKPALYQTLREWLEFNRGNLRGLELKHIEAIERLIFSRKSGRTSELPGGAAIVKESGKLSFKIFEVEK